MLWESTEAQAALTQRFQFASAEHAVTWLINIVSGAYDIPIESIDRLVISSYNLLAWLTTAEGMLIAKCCALVNAHERLSNIAALLTWLGQKGLPVSVPLLTKAGQRQLLCNHLSLGLQRVIPGDLLQPTDLKQARTAGVTLAQLHQALAAYPRAIDFIPQVPTPPLDEVINGWVENKIAMVSDPSFIAGCKALARRLKTSTLPKLTLQMVHHDYRAANILWYEGKITAVLDFEELRWGYRVNDLAWAATYLGTRFRQWGPVSAEVQAVFCEGYESSQSLTGAERAWLPILIAWHSLSLASQQQMS